MFHFALLFFEILYRVGARRNTMECGKVRSPGGGCTIFYFVLDPLTPEKPSASRVRTYYVVTHVDSYVEAYYYLARHFSAPATSLDEAIERWHALYTRVFGTVTLESFRKSLISVPVQHFHLCATEEAAREKARECGLTNTMQPATQGTGAAGNSDLSFVGGSAAGVASHHQSRRISPPRHRSGTPSGMPDASAIPHQQGVSHMHM